MKHFAFLFFICPLFSSCIWVAGDGDGLDEKPSYVANTKENDREDKIHAKVMPSSKWGNESWNWNENTGEYSNEKYGFSWRLYEIDGSPWIRIKIDEPEGFAGKTVFSAYNTLSYSEGISVGVTVFPAQESVVDNAWDIMDLMENTENIQNMEKVMFCGKKALKCLTVEKTNDGSEVLQFSYVYLSKGYMVLPVVVIPESTYKKLNKYSLEALVDAVFTGYSIDDKN